jgi:flagellar biogenesis protein FliO
VQAVLAVVIPLVMAAQELVVMAEMELARLQLQVLLTLALVVVVVWVLAAVQPLLELSAAPVLLSFAT